MRVDITDMIMKVRFELMVADKYVTLFDNVICELMDVKIKKDSRICHMFQEQIRIGIYAHDVVRVVIQESFSKFYFEYVYKLLKLIVVILVIRTN